LDSARDLYFAAIGFPPLDCDHDNPYVSLALNAGLQVASPKRNYIRWQAGNGAELWLQLDGTQRVVAVAPHFSGQARVRAGVTERREKWENGILVGGFYSWADLFDDDDPEAGMFPLIFDTPDYLAYADLMVPAVYEVQVAAFADGLTVYEDEDAYYGVQGDVRIKIAAESFYPSSGPYATFSGEVLNAASLLNPATKAPFLSLQVRTFGGEIDVVADPSLVNGPIRVGNIVTCSCWLSGRPQRLGQSRRNGRRNGNS
jgi:hypothetical protein